MRRTTFDVPSGGSITSGEDRKDDASPWRMVLALVIPRMIGIIQIMALHDCFIDLSSADTTVDEDQVKISNSFFRLRILKRLDLSPFLRVYKWPSNNN